MGTAGPLAARVPHGNVTRSPGTQGASGHRLGRRGPAPCEPQLRDGSCPSAVRGAGVRPLRPPVPRKLRQARHGMPGQGRAADERPQVTLGADVQRARSQQEPRARALTGHRLLPDGGRGGARREWGPPRPRSCGPGSESSPRDVSLTSQSVLTGSSEQRGPSGVRGTRPAASKGVGLPSAPGPGAGLTLGARALDPEPGA